MSTLDLNATPEALAALADAITLPLPRRRSRKSRRHRCLACSRTFFRSRLTPHRCPHCHSDSLVEVGS